MVSHFTQFAFIFLFSFSCKNGGLFWMKMNYLIESGNSNIIKLYLFISPLNYERPLSMVSNRYTNVWLCFFLSKLINFFWNEEKLHGWINWSSNTLVSSDLAIKWTEQHFRDNFIIVICNNDGWSIFQFVRSLDNSNISAKNLK